MALIRDGKPVPDPWRVLGDDEALPEHAPVIVSYDRWQAGREELVRRDAPLGIRLGSDQAPTPIAGDLERFSLVALEFPTFTDGRAYSYARLLRERYGYAGEVRATGNVLGDQLAFMLRCGFDTFEVADGVAAAWSRATSEISFWYQPAADGRQPIAALRHRGTT